MTSTRELRKTLPAKAPNTDRHRAVASSDFSIPIYTLVAVRPNLEQTKKDINRAGLSTRSACIAPQADFAGRSLRDVLDYHLQLRDQNQTIHPLCFIVADQVDYRANGVLMIYLNADTPGEDDDNDHVGVGRTGIDMVESWVCNIDIGNISWMDLKESEAADWDGEDPYEGIDPLGQASPKHAPESSKRSEQKYGWYGNFAAGTGQIREMIEPGSLRMPPHELRCRMLANVSNMDDHWAGIRELHPEACQDRPDVHRTLVLVANKPEANEDDGMAVVQLEWDGKVDGLTTTQLRALRPEMLLLQNVRASEALEQLDKILLE